LQFKKVSGGDSEEAIWGLACNHSPGQIAHCCTQRSLLHSMQKKSIGKKIDRKFMKAMIIDNKSQFLKTGCQIKVP
jgi:hypothetical protein